MLRKASFPVLIAGVGTLLAFTLGSYPTYVLGIWAVYALAALGLTFVAGWTGELSVGHAALMSLAAYAVSVLDIHDALIALVVGAVIGGVAGLVLGLPSTRVSGLGLAMITLVCGQIVQVGLDAISGIGGAAGRAIDLPMFFGSTLTMPELAALAVVVLSIFLVGAKILRDTTLGTSWRAMRDNQVLARALGCNLVSLRLWAFALSGVLCGCAGVVYSWLTAYIAPDSFDLWFSITLLAIVVVGGRDDVYGALVGSFVFIVLAEVLRITQNFQVLILGAAVVLCVIFLPGGVVSVPAEALRRARRARTRTLTREVVPQTEFVPPSHHETRSPV